MTILIKYEVVAIKQWLLVLIKLFLYKNKNYKSFQHSFFLFQSLHKKLFVTFYGNKFIWINLQFCNTPLFIINKFLTLSHSFTIIFLHTKTSFDKVKIKSAFKDVFFSKSQRATILNCVWWICSTIALKNKSFSSEHNTEREQHY